MKQILLTTVLSLSFATATVAQEKLWTLDECMRYAVENSPSVKKQVYTSDTYKAERNAAVELDVGVHDVACETLHAFVSVLVAGIFDVFE